MSFVVTISLPDTVEHEELIVGCLCHHRHMTTTSSFVCRHSLVVDFDNTDMLIIIKRLCHCWQHRFCSDSDVFVNYFLLWQSLFI